MSDAANDKVSITSGATPVAIMPRAAQTAADVSGHYDELDRPYREIWGDHIHHGYWRTGRESPEEAVVALVDFVADRLALTPGMAVCDIGCGYGASGAYLAEHYGLAVTGLTISSAQARVAGGRRPAAGTFTCLERDWLDNRLPDACFDRAFAIESSEHMADKARFFSEAARTLRPGGRLVVGAWLASSAPSRWQVDHLLEPICREGRLPGMGNREDYEALARGAGFVPLGFDDISRNVRRTWAICARRLLLKLATDRHYRQLLASSHTRNRVFALTIFRLMIALRTGATRYGVFTWRK
jgi:tocopherol O-methyltransferase